MRRIAGIQIKCPEFKWATNTIQVKKRKANVIPVSEPIIKFPTSETYKTGQNCGLCETLNALRGMRVHRREVELASDQEQPVRMVAKLA
jgi:hypothetical protein